MKWYSILAIIILIGFANAGTIGYTTIGAGNTNVGANVVIGSRWLASENGQITAMNGYFDTASGFEIRYVIYDGGSILVGNSSGFNTTSTAWFTQPMGNIPIFKGQTYWLFAYYSGTPPNIYRDTSGGTSYFAASGATYSALPNPIVLGATGAVQYSLFGNYTPVTSITFGNTLTDGSTYYPDMDAGNKTATQFTMNGTGGNVTVLVAKFYGYGGRCWTAAIYADSNNVPTNKLADADNIYCQSATTGGFQIPFYFTGTNQIHLNASTSYWLGFSTTGGGGRLYEDAGGASYQTATADGTTNSSNTFGSVLSSRNVFKQIYVNISLDATPPPQFYNNVTSGSIAGSSISHNITWNTTGALSGYICSFFNGGNTTFSYQSSDLVTGTMREASGGLQNYSTGILSPYYQTPLAGQGWFNASGALFLGGNRTMMFAQTTSTSGANQTAYYGYSVNLTAEKTIMAIAVYSNISVSTATGTNTIGFSVSNDSGVTYGAAFVKPSSSLTTTFTIFQNGSSGSKYGDLWGQIWNVSNLNNIRVNATGTSAATSRFPRLDYVGINVTYQNFTNVVDGNTTTDNYSYLTNVVGEITNISITVNVSAYNNSLSLIKGNANPDLWLEVWNTSSYIIVGNMSVTQAGNKTIYIPNNGSLYDTLSYTNHLLNFSIKGVYLDSNSSLQDYINYTDLTVNINSTNDFVNDSWTAFSGTSNVSQMVKTINSTVGAIIQWYCAANDSSNQWNVSTVYSYTTTSSTPFVYVYTVYTLGGGLNSTNAMEFSLGNSTEAYYFNSSSMYKELVRPCANPDGVTNCQISIDRNPLYRILNVGNVDITGIYMKLTSPAPTGVKVCANSTGTLGVAQTVDVCDLSGSKGNLNDSAWIRLSLDLPKNMYLNVTVYANFSGLNGGQYSTINSINGTDANS